MMVGMQLCLAAMRACGGRVHVHQLSWPLKQLQGTHPHTYTQLWMADAPDGCLPCVYAPAINLLHQNGPGQAWPEQALTGAYRV